MKYPGSACAFVMLVAALLTAAAAQAATVFDRQVFVGNKLNDLFAVRSGFTEVLVKLNDTVKTGQKVAIQRDAFGDVVHEYVAGADGRVAIIGTDAIRERGVDVVSILSYSSECASVACPYVGDEP